MMVCLPTGCEDEMRPSVRGSAQGPLYRLGNFSKLLKSAHAMPPSSWVLPPWHKFSQSSMAHLSYLEGFGRQGPLLYAYFFYSIKQFLAPGECQEALPIEENK